MATANRLKTVGSGEWRLFCWLSKLHITVQTAHYRNHGDAARVVFLSGREIRFTRLVETPSLLGTSLGQFASAGLREKGLH
ncbi:hypothetical protein AMECASPLE_034055 [Ameca splendens]|uniref:Uncharacterized protein n=1 Tax=Ameca splendens TaxID=208324 RepID=A0ABV1AF67_9TELE